MGLNYYFVTVPELPPEVVDQTRAVQVIAYTVKEGQSVKPGTPIATVETWWAVLQIEATGTGTLSKVFFDRGTIVKIGNPMAIIVCDPEDAPLQRPPAAVNVMQMKREKPRSDRSPHQPRR